MSQNQENEILELSNQLSQLLLNNNTRLATAESCTGGLLAGFFTALNGCSKWYEGGVVTYSNETKISMLGVDSQLIAKYGAVSDNVAEAMAFGLLNKTSANYGVSITGIAGPEGGSTEKPVGTVFIAVASSPKHVTSNGYLFQGDRATIRLQSCMQAINQVVNEIS